MGKKNPYITTIGFKKDDPDHEYVARLLNTMGRGKAQFIVKAVLVYQEVQEKGLIPRAGKIQLDYEEVKKMVFQIIDERKENSVRVENIVMEKRDALSQFDEEALDGIMASIAAFQQQ